MIFLEPPEKCSSCLLNEMEVCVNDFTFLYCINTQSFKFTKLKKRKRVCCVFVCVSFCMYVSVCVLEGGGGVGWAGDCWEIWFWVILFGLFEC